MVEGRPTRPSNESLFLFFNGWEYFHEKDGFFTSSDCLEKFHAPGGTSGFAPSLLAPF